MAVLTHRKLWRIDSRSPREPKGATAKAPSTQVKRGDKVSRKKIKGINLRSKREEKVLQKKTV